MINTIKTAAAKFSVILKEYGILQSQCPHLILNVSCVVNLKGDLNKKVINTLKKYLINSFY
jgi:hypothetical protein